MWQWRRNALGDLDRQMVAPVRPDNILQSVCDYFGLENKDLMSGRRQRTISLARSVAMYPGSQDGEAEFSGDRHADGQAESQHGDQRLPPDRAGRGCATSRWSGPAASVNIRKKPASCCSGLRSTAGRGHDEIGFTGLGFTGQEKERAPQPARFLSLSRFSPEMESSSSRSCVFASG